MQPVDIRRFQESGFERLRARERTAGALPSHRRYQYSQAAPPPLPLPATTTAPPPDPHGPPSILCFEAEALPAQRLRSKLPPSRRAHEPPEAVEIVTSDWEAPPRWLAEAGCSRSVMVSR